MGTFRDLNHTADLGIEVSGLNLEDLFITISKVIFDTQISGVIKNRKSITIECVNNSLEDLLVDWCRELLYNFSVHGFIPNTYRITVKNSRLTAHLDGDVLDTERHTIKSEIKNVTYHKLKVEKISEGYRATVIFDV